MFAYPAQRSTAPQSKRRLFASFVAVLSSVSACIGPSQQLNDPDPLPISKTEAPAITLPRAKFVGTALENPPGSLARLPCAWDSKLSELSAEVLDAYSLTSKWPNSRDLQWLAREWGVAYPVPRLKWFRQASGKVPEEAFQHWLDESTAKDTSAVCGAAKLQLKDEDLYVLVAADFLAKVKESPRYTARNSWLNWQVNLLVPVSGAKLVVLPPHGPPIMPPSSLHDSRFGSSFSLDQSGPWLLQLLADLEDGPRPVAESWIYAGSRPSAGLVEPNAPGEDAGSQEKELAMQMLHMLNEARRKAELPALQYSKALSELREQHARHMAEQGRVAHDLGKGNPKSRAEEAGIHDEMGENIAHAKNLRDAHRALWWSPSHRLNTLDAHYRYVGIGVYVDNANELWVSQEFSR